MQSKVLVVQDAKEDMDCWIKNLMACTGRSLIRQSPTLVIFSYACLSCLGAVYNGARTGRPWTADESNVNINIWE